MKKIISVVLILMMGFGTGIVIADSDIGSGTVIVGSVSPGPGIDTSATVLGYDWWFESSHLQPKQDAPNVEWIMMAEKHNLTEVGSLLSPYIINTTKDYDTLVTLVWEFSFSATTLDATKFGVGSPLTNGIVVYYNGTQYFEEIITTTETFDPQIPGMWELSTDESSNRFMDAGWPFLPNGVRIRNNREVQIYVRDDLTSLINVTELAVTLTGYKKNVNTYFYGDLEKYHPNAINEIILQDLFVGEQYNLKISSSEASDGAKWINTTALQDSVHIRYTFQAGREANVVHLDLYEDNEFLERRDIVFVPSQISALEPFIITVVGTLAVAIAVGWVGKLVIYKKNNKPKRLKTNKKKRW